MSVTQRYFDWGSTRISFGLVLLLILSLLAVPFWLVLRPEFIEATLINAFWALFNLLLLGTALLVGLEQPQLRRTHRLERRLTAQIEQSETMQSETMQSETMQSETMPLMGETIDVSESGAQILVAGNPNLPDLVSLTLSGDFGRQIRLNGQIKRRLPARNEATGVQTILAIDFTDLTPAQQDQLALVLYSDVAEWYTQQRQELDRPWQSFQFLIGGLSRVFREIKPGQSLPVRKQIQAAVQLYWEGQFYPGTATEISSRVLQIQLDSCPPELAMLRRSAQPIGILLSPDLGGSNPVNLLAQVQSIGTRQMTLAQGGQTVTTAAVPVELTFPQALDAQQAQRIRRLMQQLA